MPRKTKAELAAEKETLENTGLEATEQEQELAPLSAEETGLETADTAGLPENEPQEAAIAGLLADYSAASGEDSGEGAVSEPQEKDSLKEDTGEAPSPAGDEPLEAPIPVPMEDPPQADEEEETEPATPEPEPSPAAGRQGNSLRRVRPFSRPTSGSWTGTSPRSRCRSGTASMPPSAPNLF